MSVIVHPFQINKDVWVHPKEDNTYRIMYAGKEHTLDDFKKAYANRSDLDGVVDQILKLCSGKKLKEQ